mmetsp:Transcript_46407/g.108044  ORF Transcript_46407/g.108044 Transcript_46407/m.108044 type:complete len:915 (-) Transcript_46407:41-2785(-)
MGAKVARGHSSPLPARPLVISIPEDESSDVEPKSSEVPAVPEVKEEKASEQAEPSVWVTEPSLRGVKLRQCIDFFTENCGRCEFQEDDGHRTVHCLPDLLTSRYEKALGDGCNGVESPLASPTSAARGRSGPDLADTPRSVRTGRRANMYAVEELLVKPSTALLGVSAAEMWNPSGLPVRFYVSHAWGDDFADFIQGIYGFAAGTWFDRPQDVLLDEVTFYIDVFSENRWIPWEQQTRCGMWMMPFYRVLAAPSTERIVLLLGPRTRALHRAWCGMELYLAARSEKPLACCTRYGPLSKTQAAYIPRVESWVMHLLDKVRHLDMSGTAAKDVLQKQWLQGEFFKAVGEGIASGLHGVAAVNRQLQVLYLNELVQFMCTVGSEEGIKQATSLLQKMLVTQLLAMTGQMDQALHTVVLKPGLLGLQVAWPQGYIKAVTPGGPGSAAGLSAGWRILRINNEHATAENLQAYAAGSRDYTMVVQEDEVCDGGADSDGTVSQALAQEWARCKTLLSVAARLVDSNPQVQVAAIHELEQLGVQSVDPLVGAVVSQLFVGAPQVQEAALDMLSRLELGALSNRAESHRMLRLELIQNLECDDSSLRTLSALLPSQLSCLALDFRNNRNFTDAGMAALVDVLPLKPLTQLRLSFRSSLQITNESLLRLGSALPSGLTSLALDFRNNTSVSSDGFKALLAGFPPQLHDLTLSFAGNHNFSDDCMEALAVAMPGTLRTLSLSFHHHGNGAFSDTGLQMLAAALPASLAELSIMFHGHRDFTDLGLGVLSASLPWSLSSLWLDFHSSSRFTDTGLQQLALALPAKLKRLELNFHCSGNFTDLGLAALSAMLPRGLLLLTMDFLCNINFTDECVGRLAAALPGGLQKFHFAHKMCVQDSVASMKRRYRCRVDSRRESVQGPPGGPD